jgi:hypothetical protein
MKAFLENFAAVVGAFTVAILSMSWMHEYGYFWSVGRQFQTFLTTTDYLTNGALWFPVALFGAYNFVDWWRLTEDGPPKWDWKKRSAWIWLASGTLVFAIWLSNLTWPLAFISLITAFLVVSMIWSYIWRGWADKITVEEPFKTPLRQAVRLAPPLLIAMFMYGSVDANNDLTRTDNPYLFTFKNDVPPRLEIFLRNFDRGVLVRDVVDKRIQFRKWDDIQAVSIPAAVPTRTLLCWISGLTYKETSPPEP